MKRFFLFLLVAGLLAFLMTAVAQAEEPALTILVYMTGSNLETEGQAASKDIREMAAALPDGSGVRVLVLAGGSTAWDMFPAPDNTIYDIRGSEPVAVHSFSSRSMGDPELLAEYLRWGYEYMPAERYALILWDHGGGPLMGVCFDELYTDDRGAMDALTMNELGQVLESSPFREKKLVFIGFDACLMCTAEVASLVSPYAEYMIASQETEPASGWSYAFLDGLTGKESGAEIGHRVIETYADSLKEQTVSATLSCLDLSKTDTMLAELSAFFAEITSAINPDTYPAYTECRVNTKVLGGSTSSQFDLVDLADLIDTYETEGLADASRLKAAIDDMVVESWRQRDKYVNGLSIYYPFDNKSMFISPWASVYGQSDFSPEYRAFISRVSEYYLGDSLFNRNSDYQTQLQEEQGQNRLTLDLSTEDAAGIVRSRMLVLSEIASGWYQLIFYDDQNLRLTDQMVSSVYRGEALYVTDGDGNILAGPVSYFPADGGVAVLAILEKQISDFQWSSEAARLVYQPDDDGNLVLSQVVKLQDSGGKLYLPAAIDLSQYYLNLVNFGPAGLPGDETITSLSFTAFTDYVSFSPADGQGLAILPVWNRNTRYAYMRLTDVQGETICSQVTEMPNFTAVPIAETQDVPINSEAVSVRLLNSDLITGHDAGLRFIFEIRNISDSSLILSSEEVLLNGSSSFGLFSYRMSLAPEETDRMDVFVPLENLQRLEIPEIIDSATVVFHCVNDRGETVDLHAVVPVSFYSSIFSPETAEPQQNLSEEPPEGEIVRSILPSGADGGMVFTPCLVIGQDNRAVIENVSEFPYGAVAFMDVICECGCGWECSGVLAGRPDTVFTAAHCVVCSEHSSPAESIIFYFGYQGFRQYMIRYDKTWRLKTGTLFEDYEYSFQNDWAMIRLDENIGDQVGFLEPDWENAGQDAPQENVRIIGYSEQALYQDTGNIRIMDPEHYAYTMDQVGGESGGPILNDANQMIGIIIGHQIDDDGTESNVGHRLTEEMKEAFDGF